MMKIAIGCDPNAQKEKEEIIEYIEKKGYGEVTDFGSEDVIYAHVAVKAVSYTHLYEEIKTAFRDRKENCRFCQSLL